MPEYLEETHTDFISSVIKTTNLEEGKGRNNEKTYLKRISWDEDSSFWASESVWRFSSCWSMAAGSRWGWVCKICAKSWPTGDSNWRGATGTRLSLEFADALMTKLLDWQLYSLQSLAVPMEG